MVYTRARLDPSRGRFCKFATVSHFLMNHEDTKSPRTAKTAPLCLHAFVVERICGKFMGERKGSTPCQCWIVFATVSTFSTDVTSSACGLLLDHSSPNLTRVSKIPEALYPVFLLFQFQRRAGYYLTILKFRLSQSSVLIPNP